MRRSKKALLISIAIIIIVSFVFYQHRNIYNLGYKHYVTRWGPYIMPYKYYGLTKPKDNFIKLYNFKGTELVFISDTNIVIGEKYGDSVLMKFSKYNCKYYNKDVYDEFKKKYLDNSVYYIGWYFSEDPIYSNASVKSYKKWGNATLVE